MMFTTLAALLLAAPAVLAAALPSPYDNSQCDTGTMQCCQTFATADSYSDSADGPGSLLDVLVAGLGIPVGLDCIPVNVIGLGDGASCSAQPVCCNHVTSSGTGVDCSPVKL